MGLGGLQQLYLVELLLFDKALHPGQVKELLVSLDPVPVDVAPQEAPGVVFELVGEVAEREM